MSCGYLGNKQKVTLSCQVSLSSFQGMRKLCSTEKEKKRNKEKGKKGKKSYECSVASVSSGRLGEDKINIKNIKQNTTSTIWQAFIFPMLQGSKLVTSRKLPISHNDHTFLTLLIKAAVAAKQGLCREWSIENTETCIWLACIRKETQTRSFHCGKNPFF